MPRSNHPSWYRSRGYLHFDMPLSYRKASAIVKSPDKVAKHAFYPFLDYIITSEIIHKDATTQKLVSEPKNRPIKYASHTDSHIYAYYSDILCAAYEKAIDIRDLSDSVLAFRSLGKSNIEFAKQAFDTIRAYGECGVVALDISGFFNERVLPRIYGHIKKGR